MNDSIKLAYRNMLVESVDFEESTELDYDYIDEAVSGERPSDSSIIAALDKHEFRKGGFNFKFSKHHPDYESFSSSLEGAHAVMSRKVKSALGSELGGKVTVKKVENENGRHKSLIHVNGHPVAEVWHQADAKDKDEYRRWDKINSFRKGVTPVTSGNVNLHKEHVAKLKELGVKTKVPFTNSSIISTKTGDSSTHHWGHGSQGSVNVKTPSLVSKLVNSKPEHKTVDNWDKYD